MRLRKETKISYVSSWSMEDLWALPIYKDINNKNKFTGIFEYRDNNLYFEVEETFLWIFKTRKFIHVDEIYITEVETSICE